MSLGQSDRNRSYGHCCAKFLLWCPGSEVIDEGSTIGKMNFDYWEMKVHHFAERNGFIYIQRYHSFISLFGFLVKVVGSSAVDAGLILAAAQAEKWRRA